MLTLEQITQQPRVLLDTTVLELGSIGTIEDEIQILKNKIALLENSSSLYVVKEVLEEVNEFKKHMKKGSKRIKQRLNLDYKEHQRFKTMSFAIEAKTKALKRLARKLKDISLDLSHIPNYQLLYQTLCYLSDILGIKDPKKRTEKKRTDEANIATAFYLTSCSPNETAILSNDGHFPQLSIALIRELLIPTIYSPVKEIITLAKNRGVKIYRNVKGGQFYQLEWDSKLYKPDRRRLKPDNIKDLNQLLQEVA